MKRLLSILIVICLCATISGCSAKEAIASDKQEYIVSALGFDNDGSEILMILEAIAVNSDDLTLQKQSLLITGTGKTAAEAFAEIIEKTTQPLMFSHCAVIVVGKELSGKQLENIFDFCYEKDEINLAAMFVTAEKSRKLLSCKPLSSVAMGYDIVTMAEVFGEERGIIFENLFYEIESARNKEMKTFSIPFFKVVDKKFSLNGITIFKNNRSITDLKMQEAQVFSFITNGIKKGNLILEDREIKINSSKTTYDFSFGERLRIEVNIKLDASGSEDFIKGEVEKIFSLAGESGNDIFALGNIISHQSPEIWNQIKGNYKEYFKNAMFKVNING